MTIAFIQHIILASEKLSISGLQLTTILILLLIFGSAALFYASYSISAGIYLKSLCSNPKAEDQISLTFDDGVNPEFTTSILNILKKHNAKATFFLIGERAEAYPDIVRRIVAEGHTIGNHSYYHKWNLAFKSKNQIETELAQCTAVLEKITHKKITLFRPPFGVTNPNISKAVKNNKLQSIGWSIRSFDTIGQENDVVFKRVVRQLSPGKVILLHDNRATTPLLVEQLLFEIEKRKWKAVTVNQLFNLPE